MERTALRLLNWQLVITLCLLSFIIGCYITFLLFINNVTDFSDSSIISAFISSGGSIFGGLFGGIIAFVIARSQFTSDKKRDKDSKTQIYLNLIKALKVELIHNQTILKFLYQNNKDKKPYIKAIKYDVWDNIKYSPNNFLPENCFAMIDKQNQEFKEIQEGILPEYESDKVNFELRHDVITKIIETLEIEEKKHKSNFDSVN